MMSSDIVFGVAVLLVTLVLVLGVYLASWHYWGRKLETSSKDLAASIVYRISGLHALILGLVFAQIAMDFRDLQIEISREANLAQGIFEDAYLHGDENASELRASMLGYLDAVIAGDWRALQDDERAPDESDELLAGMYRLALDFSDVSGRQRELKSIVLDNLRALEEIRNSRAYPQRIAGQAPFWLAAIPGLLLISVCYLGFPPTRSNIAMIGIFALYNGVVLFLILAYANPHAEPGVLEPDALVMVRDELAMRLGNVR